MSNTNMKFPAFKRLEHDQRCFQCKHDLLKDKQAIWCESGDLAFYAKNQAGPGSRVWHEECGDPSWKEPGTAYHDKLGDKFKFKPKPIAVGYDDPILDPFQMQVAVAAKMFCRETVIFKTHLTLAPALIAYLIINDYIDEHADGKAYIVLPKAIEEFDK